MSDPFLYTYPSPLEGYENLPPLSDELNEDGKSLKNPETGVLSEAYQRFTSGITNGQRAGFDVHIYYHTRSAEQTEFARALWERVRREFPELRVYRFWDHPVGPHTLAMFEVNIFTPAQFGAFIPWLVINRGPLSALVHPNTEDGEDLRAHSQRATWLGERVPLDLGMLKKFDDKRRSEQGKDGSN
ncbi:DOPA 4,5-dioxygenase [Capronia epimyces CBS 606.96]|uniref:DOPA 4,5-dioxygenase n=1 Tax=Capronia epimyces CBS 606.96 TaxID=1182542 RepID=W9XRH8_9EURO|nr:DOPA 4,5-dioxygenase [Capronia epimyces CBS 606.96]EXJ79596.1 DOPA 4,5-dioxygenase [Capronia epimyces CBS 606.96]